MASVRVRKVMVMIALDTQLTHVVMELPVLRAQIGYISEFIVQGIGPIPTHEINSTFHSRHFIYF